MRSVVSVVVSVAVGLVLVIAAPNARPSFAAARESCAKVLSKKAVDSYWSSAYNNLYFEPDPGVRRALFLQFGDDPAVERLVDKNESRLFEAFLALHAPGYAPADIAGFSLIGVGAHRLGPKAATGTVTLNITAKPGRGLKMTVPFVCGRDTGNYWFVPLDDLCRALRAAHADQQCSKALLRKAKKGLPRSLAKAPTRSPKVVTTPTAVPPTVPTTFPTTFPTTVLTTRPPFPGDPCNPQNTPPPGYVCK